jgi:magnesium chelatase subunit D
MLALLDRMAFTLDLTSPVDECLPEELFNTASSKPRVVAPIMQPQALRQARKHLSQTIMPRSAIVSICEAAVDMSISSVRASVLCARACRGLAALNHREEVSTEDVDTAINLVLSWRAAPTAEQLNSSSESTQAANDQQSEQPSQTTSAQATTPDKSTVPEVDQSDTNASAADGGRLEEQTVEITRSELPEGLLGTIAQVPGKTDNTNRGQQGRVGVAQQSSQRGRPIGAQRGRPEGHKKIHIHATLRAAVPWQRARRRSHQQHQEARHLIVMPEDLHIARYSVVRRNVTIFVVDASGSAAAQRLSEAKGAVELLLAECYVRRDEVSLIVYQGAAARVVLPPTRSLARARRELANLPGGGGTPLASALTLAADVAQRVVQNGSTPLLCVLTDGRANVDRAGIGGRERAEQHALLAASELGQLGVRTLVIDFALRPRALSKQLAANAKGTMLALPRADAASIHNALANGSR